MSSQSPAAGGGDRTEASVVGSSAQPSGRRARGRADSSTDRRAREDMEVLLVLDAAAPRRALCLSVATLADGEQERCPRAKPCAAMRTAVPAATCGGDSGHAGGGNYR